jgi:hypothetical protein
MCYTYSMTNNGTLNFEYPIRSWCMDTVQGTILKIDRTIKTIYILCGSCNNIHLTHYK